MLRWFSGRASHNAICASTMKYFSPFFSYMMCSVIGGLGSEVDGLQVEADVLRRVLGVGEQHGVVVEVHHPPVVGGHDLLEVVQVELGAERVGNLVKIEGKDVVPVHADHRRELGDRDVGFARHDLRDDVAVLVVHQGDAAHVRRPDRGAELHFRTHQESSLGWSRSRSDNTLRSPALAASKDAENGTVRSWGCDQIGCSSCAAAMLSSTHLASQRESSSRLWSRCSGSLVSIANSARV